MMRCNVNVNVDVMQMSEVSQRQAKLRPRAAAYLSAFREKSNPHRILSADVQVLQFRSQVKLSFVRPLKTSRLRHTHPSL